jgi:phosphoribosylformylglycinamidine synthase
LFRAGPFISGGFDKAESIFYSPAMPSPITPEIVAEHGLSPEEYDRVLHALGRDPNLTELGIFSVMWSEHCSYKSSRVHLRKLPTEAPWVIQGPGENAGVIDIGDNKAAIFKMESHNHPSYIEPYQGAATGVGGILRDVFTMGARPVANLNALRFGRPDHPRTRHLVAGVVAGIGGYGNCVGVPTVGGEVNFHSAYDGNILVNAMTVGIAEQDRIFYSAAAGIGNPVVYVGSKTGRDGIHGATMASADFSEDSEEKRPTVQVGDPFTEKLLIEACLELMASDSIVAIQDMGAAGLTSSSVEMASKGGVGLELDMNAVPCREEGMTPYEMMLSESQERMLMVLKPGREAEAEAIFRKWELDFAVIGRVTDTGRLVLKWNGETAADIPLAPLADDAPCYDRPWVETPKPAPLDGLPGNTDIAADLLKLMASPDLASRRWIWEQYDQKVGGDTVQPPGGGDSAVVRIHGTGKALAATTDVTPRYCHADPREGGKQAIAEAWRNLCAVGARPLAATDCLNFGNPQRPEIMGQLVGCIEGMAEACRALDFPIVSGNVSLYNETKAEDGTGTAILPTPAIGGVGLIDDWRKAVGIAFKGPGDVIVVIGTRRGHLGQSLWLREVHGREEGPPPPVDLAAERSAGEFVRAAIAGGAITACHDVADGGLAVAIAEMALAGRVGALVNKLRPDRAADLFAEDQGVYVATICDNCLLTFLARAHAAGVEVEAIGRTCGSRLIFELPDGDHALSLADLREAHEGFFPRLMGDEPAAA